MVVSVANIFGFLILLLTPLISALYLAITKKPGY
jgi:hypothetical protein